MKSFGVFCIFAVVLGRSVASANAADGPANTPPVRFTINHGDGVYHEKDKLRIHIQSDVDAFVYVFYVQASGTVAMLLPNDFQDGNRIAAGGSLLVGAGDATKQNELSIDFEVTAPGGDEAVQVLSSLAPLSGFEDIRHGAQRSIVSISMEEFEHLSQTYVDQNALIVRETLPIKNLSVQRVSHSE